MKLLLIKGEEKLCDVYIKDFDRFLINKIKNKIAFLKSQTIKNFKVFHKLNWKSSGIVYPTKCTICKIQYFG